MPWLKLFPLLLTLLSFLQPLAANASTLLLPLAAAESADVSAAHRDTVSFCRSTAKDSSAHRDAVGASLVAVIDGTATAADYENIGGGIADFGMVAVIGGVKGAGEGAARFNGPKPGYAVNPAHVPGRGLKLGKTPLPADAEQVFKGAVPNDAKNPTAWFGKNADGQIYRFSPGNDGTAHFSGIHGVGDGTRNITQYAIDRLNAL